MRIVTLLLKVKDKSASPYELTDSSFTLCGPLLKSVMGQLLVGLQAIKYEHLYVSMGCSQSS